MKDFTVHCAEDEELNLLLDGRLSREEEQGLRTHIAACDVCRTAFANLGLLDGTLRGLPIVKTRADFTQSTMQGILSTPKSSLVFRLLEKVSYVFGLLIVLGIMIAAFVVTGVFDQSQIDQTRTVTGGLIAGIGEQVTSSISGFTSLLVQYLPFAFGHGSMGVAFFVVAVVVMLAAVDRVVGKRVLQK